MKITYIDHSGFFVMTAHAQFLFDYWKGRIPALNPELPLYVLVSHVHSDHYNPAVLELKKTHPDTWYLLSDDIPAVPSDRTLLLSPGRYENAGGLKLDVLKSTDEGVAYAVECGDCSIYHAGDLHWWTWPGEETEEEFNDMTARFQSEINKIRGRHFDAAFLPLDPRQEDRYAWGFDYAARAVDADCLIPMHQWEKYNTTGRLLKDPVSAPYRDKIWYITKRGETKELKQKN